MRRDYETQGLRESDLAPTWVEQFDRWFADAVAAELPEPNAVVVATADADGAPDARIVLVKGYDEYGFVFGTSYASTKGAQLAVNPRAALVFPWHALQRQVRVNGRVERVGPGASDNWPPRRRCSPPSSTPARSWSNGCAGWTPTPPTAGCPGPRCGAATGSCPTGWSSGRAAPTGCTTGSGS
jgi:pyridoxine/pyridoxamine 5'-phosphate oxidase